MSKTAKKHLKVNYGSDAFIYDVKTTKTLQTFVSIFTFSKLDRQWANPGKEAGRIENTGNGYRIKLGEREIDLDYSEAGDLMLLLREASIVHEDERFPLVQDIKHTEIE